MNKYQYHSAIEREINKINQRIDVKIISGLNYADEARRHKRLLAEMRRLGKSRQSFWPRVFRTATAFMF